MCFNYGSETWSLKKYSVKMCEYVRMRNSDKDLWTSKNGEFVENIN